MDRARDHRVSGRRPVRQLLGADDVLSDPRGALVCGDPRRQRAYCGGAGACRHDRETLMCGIAGFAGIGLRMEESTERVGAMCDAIQYRGPDSDGYFVANGIAMGVRRLSIIDVAGGRQPISNEDGTVTVVFNGEIYNHQALRRELEASGHRFATRSDTEVLVHLYEEFGTGMARHLQGMFAFSIWDSRNQRLFIARDRTGMKPLSYADRSGGIVFCSELRSLYAFDRSTLKVAAGAVMEYLAFGY